MGVEIRNNIIDEIKSRCNIVDVIGRHVLLKKTGSNYKGVCPFHNEKTPSFVVSDTKQIFTCFGCGATGDVIEFVQRYNNLDFPGTLEKLCDEYGIEMKHSSFQTEQDRTALYEINREAATFFYRAFFKNPNSGYDYMKKRGLEPETLRKFGIGYADEEWDSLYRYFMKKSTDLQILVKQGLISHSKGKYFDRYRNRIIFPIINTRGKVIGFGGRILGDGGPKYLNSPESTIFQKKNNLYGLNLTRQDINKEKYIILVEGYMDVLSLYQHGVRNVLASLGTALTEKQAAMIKRYSDNVILAYDADEAGQAAALRGLNILHKTGCKVKVMNIIDGKDPDDFVMKEGKEEFLKLVKNAMSFADYKIHLLKQKLDLETTEGSVEFLQETAKILGELSPVEADVYIKKIARETNISEEAIRLEINVNNNSENIKKHNTVLIRDTGKKSRSERNIPESVINMEKNLIKLMLLKSSYVDRIIPYDWIFQSSSAFKIYDMIKSVYKADGEIDMKKVEDSLETADNKLLQDIIENIPLAGKEEQVFQDCIQRIKKAKHEKEIYRLRSRLDDEKDPDKVEALTIEIMKLQEIIKLQKGKTKDR